MHRSAFYVRVVSFVVAGSLIASCSGGGNNPPTPQRTATPVPTTPAPSPTATPRNSPPPNFSPSPSPSATSSLPPANPTPSPTASPTATATPSPTATPTRAPSPSPTPTPAPTPTAKPTATPTPTATPATAGPYACSSQAILGASARNINSARDPRRTPSRIAANREATGFVAVTYAGEPANKSQLFARERTAGASLASELRFTHIGRYTRILSVRPGTEAAAIATLRTQPGVISATLTGTRRYRESVTTNYFPNDPYYNGFTAAQNTTAGNNAPATYHVGPYEEAAGVPGQWDMHAVRLDYAMAYAQANNGSGIVNAGALGNANVKIANIDAGQDTTHPELRSKVVYQKCYVTNPSGVQSTSNFSTDEDGHGTDTSGLSVAAPGNGVGFVGSGGASSLMAFRVFPTPDDSCGVGDAGDAQCGADTRDIASAVINATSNGANVISMSIGGGGCSSGTDEDSVEGNAIADALAANVVVVAASGNSGSGNVSAPACIAGVIAVGASSLADGSTNGSNRAGGTASSPVEYVASYSQYGSPAKAANSSSAWGIVAPGGDPNTSDDADDLHWIENIWTTTPFMATPNDQTFAGNCNVDYPGSGNVADCRTLIAGTSMATPIVAGAAALIIAANGTYQSPAMMKSLLCSTAHDIGDAHEGCGRLDIYRAMATAVGDPSLPASK